MTDKLWVRLEVLPRPRMKIEGIRQNVCSGYRWVEYPGCDKTSNHAIFHVEGLRPCFLFKIEPEDFLFFFGHRFQATDALKTPYTVSILSRRPSKSSQDPIADDDAGGKDEGYTEVRLTIYPKWQEPEGLDQADWQKQNRGRRYEYWKKIARRCLKPFKYWLKPVGHRQ